MLLFVRRLSQGFACNGFWILNFVLRHFISQKLKYEVKCREVKCPVPIKSYWNIKIEIKISGKIPTFAAVSVTLTTFAVYYATNSARSAPRSPVRLGESYWLNVLNALANGINLLGERSP